MQREKGTLTLGQAAGLAREQPFAPTGEGRDGRCGIWALRGGGWFALKAERAPPPFIPTWFRHGGLSAHPILLENGYFEQ